MPEAVVVVEDNGPQTSNPLLEEVHVVTPSEREVGQGSFLTSFQTPCSVDIAGQPTDVLVTRFSDRNVVIVNQIGKIGTLFQGRRDVRRSGGGRGRGGNLMRNDIVPNMEEDDLDYEKEEEEGEARRKEKEYTYTVKCLSGKRDDLMMDVYANLIVKAIDEVDPEKPVVLALGLKEKEIPLPVLQEIIELVVKIGEWRS
eukprot:Nk52_evm7s328 gene=Nk52_evmTU7s328